MVISFGCERNDSINGSFGLCADGFGENSLDGSFLCPNGSCSKHQSNSETIVRDVMHGMDVEGKYEIKQCRFNCGFVHRFPCGNAGMILAKCYF